MVPKMQPKSKSNLIQNKNSTTPSEVVSGDIFSETIFTFHPSLTKQTAVDKPETPAPTTIALFGTCTRFSILRKLRIRKQLESAKSYLLHCLKEACIQSLDKVQASIC